MAIALFTLFSALAVAPAGHLIVAAWRYEAFEPGRE